MMFAVINARLDGGSTDKECTRCDSIKNRGVWGPGSGRREDYKQGQKNESVCSSGSAMINQWERKVMRD